MALYPCDTKTNEHGRELAQHGTALFPVACYHDNLTEKTVPWHWHTELEAFVVSEGTAVAAAGTDRITVKQGEGFFINSGVLHAVWTYGDEVCRLHSVVFHPRLIGGSIDSVFCQKYTEPLINHPNLRSVYFDHTNTWMAEAAQTINAAWFACAEEPSGYEFHARNALSLLVALLMEHCPAISKHPSKKALRDEERIKIMIQYIQENYVTKLDTASIAESVSISESECLRCFRSTIGMPPMQYVREFRLQKASELLSSTEMGIAEIGTQCGFFDASYFTKTFHEQKGFTPSEYRNSHL